MGTGSLTDPRLVRHAFERGITYFNTAESYPLDKPGLAERVIGSELHAHRDAGPKPLQMLLDRVAHGHHVASRNGGDADALERGDHVFEEEFAFLEPAYPQLVDHGIVLQAVYQVVEITVADT